jgi:hypothetical protein
MQGMPSAEVAFDEAWAEALGPLDQGAENWTRLVQETTRRHQAVLACGMMQRACLEAISYAGYRRIDGQLLREHPSIARTLSLMKVETAACVARTFRLLALADRLGLSDTAFPSQGAAAQGLDTLLNSYATSRACVAVLGRGSEILGGNGFVEDFSPLPRLYRDALALGPWGGSPQQLCAQVLHDVSERGLHHLWLQELRQTLQRELTHPALAHHRHRLDGLWQEVSQALAQLLLLAPRQQALLIGPLLERMSILKGYLSLLLELAGDYSHPLPAPLGAEKGFIVELYRQLWVDRCSPFDELPLLDTYTALSLRE